MFERELSNDLKKEDLFDNLLNSIESQYGEQIDPMFEEWKREGPLWQKEIISEALILQHKLGGELNLARESLVSEIFHKVWHHFETKHLFEETMAIKRRQILDGFREVVSSSMDIPEATKKVVLESLKKPFSPRENLFREVVGLTTLKGEENGNGEV